MEAIRDRFDQQSVGAQVGRGDEFDGLKMVSGLLRQFDNGG